MRRGNAFPVDAGAGAACYRPAWAGVAGALCSAVPAGHPHDPVEDRLGDHPGLFWLHRQSLRAAKVWPQGTLTPDGVRLWVCGSDGGSGRGLSVALSFADRAFGKLFRTGANMGSDLASVLRRPLGGYGFDAFWSMLNGEATRVFSATGWVVTSAHSGFLNVALELGLVGLALVGLTLLQACRYASAAFTPGHSGYVDWCIGIVFLTIVYNLDERTLMAPQYLPWILYILACVGLRKAAFGQPDAGMERHDGGGDLVSRIRGPSADRDGFVFRYPRRSAAALGGQRPAI